MRLVAAKGTRERKRPGDSESIQVKEDRGHNELPTHEGVGKEEALGAEGTGPWKGEALPDRWKGENEPGRGEACEKRGREDDGWKRLGGG